MKEELKQEIAAVIARCAKLEVDKIIGLLEKPKNKDHGDLAFPCFILAKALRCSPVECAAKLAAELELPSGVQEAVPTGPFLNFRFDRGMLIGDALARAISQEPLALSEETVVVEYSSPNIAKPFHVGHLRATLIGNSLDRVYRALGCDTISVNHLGDWGTQFGFVWSGCEIWGKPEQPSVASLVDLYRRATALREAQDKDEVTPEDQKHPKVNDMARAYFLDLEKGEPYAVDFWKECVNVSLDYLKATYARLDISFDHYTGESFYSDKLEDLERDLKDAGLLIESQGALGVDLGEKLGFARIATPDGRSLYLSRDLATAKYRAETFNFDQALYVVGAPQTLHFQQIKGVLGALGRDYAEKITHVGFGHVMGMKTRGGGNFIELNDFLDEAYERALQAYRDQVSKRPEGLDETEVARAVASAAILFSTLSRSNIKDVHFDWKHALEFQGDSGPYLLYAFARINGIKEKALLEGHEINPSANISLLSEESAFQLATLIGDFEEEVGRTAQDKEPSYLCAYGLELAKAFSKAYLDLQVLGQNKDLAEARLLLFEAARITVGKVLRLLGITPIGRM